jgi:hypothetical protein
MFELLSDLFFFEQKEYVLFVSVFTISISAYGGLSGHVIHKCSTIFWVFVSTYKLHRVLSFFQTSTIEKANFSFYTPVLPHQREYPQRRQGFLKVTVILKTQLVRIWHIQIFGEESYK